MNFANSRHEKGAELPAPFSDKKVSLTLGDLLLTIGAGKAYQIGETLAKMA